jgi:hypothetical protein
MKKLFIETIALTFFIFSCLYAHHYKGLPHYGYFDNYPQVPAEEFLGQAGPYEFSLVVYDFQGMTMTSVEQPDDVRLFLVILDMKENRAYKKAVKLEILDNKKTLSQEDFKTSEEESLYQLHTKLNEEGNYSLRVTLLEEDGLVAHIPFLLSTQKTNWALWISISMILFIVVAAIGSRKARLVHDRKNANQKKVRN